MIKTISIIAGVLFLTTLKSQTSNTICAGSSVTLQATNPLIVSNASYSIQPGGISNATGNFVVTPASTTTYTLFTSGLNASNTTVSSSIVSTVVILSQPFSVPNVTQASCTNSLSTFNLNLSFTPSVPAYTIHWNQIPNGIVSSQQTSVTANMSPGVYNTTITAIGGCSVTSSLTIYPQPDPANFQLSPLGNSYTLNCYQPILTVSVSPANNSYSWTNSLTSPISGTTAAITPSTLGNWTLTALNPVSGCTATQVFMTSQNFTVPTSTLTSTLINVSCTQTIVPSLTLSGTPLTDVQHNVLSPFGGTYSAISYSIIYLPGGPGTYTDCFVNTLNGCSICKTFTVTASNGGFPTYSVTSPQNFTLGCNSKSVAAVQITNASSTNSLQTPSGGPISYTLLMPNSTVTLPTGTLSGLSNFTVNFPGSYTVVTKDNVSFCENRTTITVKTNTNLPDLFVSVPLQILDCNHPSTLLEGFSQTPNVSFKWYFAGFPGSSSGSSLTVNADFSASTQSLVNNYTLTVEDLSSTCKSSTLVPIYQNIFPPKAKISSGTNSVLTCVNPTLALTNISSSGIPANSIFQTGMPVIGYQWFGPPYLDMLQLSTIYIASAPGTYTLEAKDLNNGCKSQTTIVIGDNRVYPQINMPGSYFVECPGTVILSAMVNGLGAGNTYSWTAPFNATTSSTTGSTLITSSPGYYWVLVSNTITGCASTASTVVQACVGIGSQNSEIANFKIFPNPNNGVFTITSEHLTENSKIEIYNMLGVLVKSEVFNSDKEVMDLQIEPSGIYFVQIFETNTLIYTMKFIKE